MRAAATLIGVTGLLVGFFVGVVCESTRRMNEQDRISACHAAGGQWAYMADECVVAKGDGR